MRLIFEQQVTVHDGDAQRFAETISDRLTGDAASVDATVDGDTVNIAVEIGAMDSALAGQRVHGWIALAAEQTGATIQWGAGSYRAEP